MKTLKKVLILCLLLVLSISLLTACGEDASIQDFQNQNTKSFTVTYDVNAKDAIFVPNGTVNQVNTYIGKHELIQPSDPIREGYDFGGWFRDKACTDQFLFGWPHEGNLVLYAKWMPKRKYRFEFYENTNGNANLLFKFDDLYKESKIKPKQINDQKIAIEQQYETAGKLESDKFNWVFRDEQGDLFSYETTVKVADYIEKAKKDKDDVYVYKLYTKLVPIKTDFNFIHGTFVIANVSVVKGALDFSTAKNKVGLLKDEDFIIENGVRVMPKPNIPDGHIFKEWRLVTKTGERVLYNENGYELNESGIPTDKKFVDREKFDDIERIECATKLRKCTVEYYVDGNPKPIKVYEYDYGTILNVKPTLAEIGLPNDKEVVDWVYEANYADMNVILGDSVDFTSHQVKVQEGETVKIKAVFENVVKRVVFQVKENQYFNLSSPSSYWAFTLDELNNILKNINDNSVAGDFNRIIGGMYFVYPGIDVPLLNEAIKTEAQLAKERELLKQQYTLVGFVDTATQETVLKVENGVIKTVSGKALEIVGKNKINLEPKFELRRDLTVTIEHSADEIISNGKEVYYTSFKNDTSINGVTAQKNGYKFVKWVVASNPLGEEYNGVTFTNDYKILGNITIKPVFEVVEHSATFVDKNGMNQFIEEQAVFKGSINKSLTKEQIDLIRNKQKELAPIVEAGQEKYYVFDDWYASIGGVRTSFTTFVQNGAYVTEDMRFVAEFKYVPFTIRYMVLDKYASKNTIIYKVGKEIANSFDKNGIIAGSQIYAYTSPLQVGNVNFVKGWYFIDKEGLEQAFDETTKVSEDIVDISNGNVLVVYPKFVEFNVTLDANGGTFAVTDSHGYVTNSTTISVNAGYFGFEIPNTIVLNRAFYEQVSDKQWILSEKTGDVYVKDNKEPITKDCTLKANWTPINFVVTLMIDGVENSEYVGNVERIFDAKTDADLTIDKIMTLLFDGINNKEEYDYKIYIVENDIEFSVKELPRPIKKDTVIFAEKYYKKKALTLDANGGLFNGSVTRGDTLIETYIGDKAVDMYSPNGGYFTKNQKVDPVDQGKPSREDYVFNGWATKPNANFATDKIYYAYKDVSDLREKDIAVNKVWLGADDFKVQAEGDIIVNGTTVKLYAQWIPVKTKINYVRRDGSILDVEKYIGYNKGFKYILNPNEIILNPINYNPDLSDDNVITWSLTKGDMDTIDSGIVASRYNNYKESELTLLNDEMNGYHYETELSVYECIDTNNIQIVINVNYMGENGNVNKTATYGVNDYFENDLADITKHNLVLESKDGIKTGYVLRKTYITPDGKCIDSIFDTIKKRPFEYAKNLNGRLMGGDGATNKYVIDMEVEQGYERIPIYFNTTYIASGNNVATASRLNKFDESVKYPYENVKVVVKYNPNTQKYEQKWLTYESNKGTILGVNWKTKEHLPLGNNMNFEFNGAAMPKKQMINGAPAFIYDARVQATWQEMTANNGGNIEKVYIEYKYKQNPDDKIYQTYGVPTEILISETFTEAEMLRDHVITNPTATEIKDMTSNYSAQKSPHRRTWVIAGTRVDKKVVVDSVSGKTELQNQLHLNDLMDFVDVVYKTDKYGSKYWSITIEAFEEWVPNSNNF